MLALVEPSSNARVRRFKLGLLRSIVTTLGLARECEKGYVRPVKMGITIFKQS